MKGSIDVNQMVNYA